MTTRTMLEKGLAAAPGLLTRLRLRAGLIHELGKLLMNVNDELSADLDVLQPTVTAIIAAYKAVQQLNIDLAAQISAGADRSLTVEQAAAFKTRVNDLQKQMQDAITPAVVEPTPDVTPTPTP